jgi:hypothetical protein
LSRHKEKIAKEDYDQEKGVLTFFLHSPLLPLLLLLGEECWAANRWESHDGEGDPNQMRSYTYLSRS